MQDYTYYFVAAPWLCVKLMKLLQCFPTPGKDTHHLTHPLSPPFRLLTYSTHPSTYSCLSSIQPFSPPFCSFTHTHPLSLPLSLSLSLSPLTEDPIVKSRLAEAIDAILTKAQVMSSNISCTCILLFSFFLSGTEQV